MPDDTAPPAPLPIASVAAQLRTTNLADSIDFYTSLGFIVEFRFADFYAGVRCGSTVVHLKQIDEPDPSVAFVDRNEHFHLYFATPDVAAVAKALAARGIPLVRDLHHTAWGTRECVVKDNAGHTLYFGQRL